ncbi:MAG: 3-phosphoshikimate 1-carboxyvinyltransferase [Taibaiella sp.]|nr:3-phosphoshikimate 1-carboxyvinyltransferase [Taibaiella sp.]
MKATIEPGYIKGVVAAPPSKSLTQRALAAALLQLGSTIINNAGYSADEQAALQIIQQLGAKVTEVRQNNGLRQFSVSSNGVHPITDKIDCGESGLSARLFTPIAALHSSPVTISGHGSLAGRKLEGVKEMLTALGVTLTGFQGHIPFTVCGPIQATSLKINATGSSQLLSGLLFSLSACATTPLSIRVTGLESKPYIDLTMDVLAQFGKPIAHRIYREFFIDPASYSHKDIRQITIEADWSSASFLLVAGAIAGEVTVEGLNVASLQADRAILDVLQQAGAVVTVGDTGILVRKSRMRAFDFDATNCPDLFPILATLAANCNGDSRIRGVHRLFNKESNRVESVTEMLWSFGVHFSVEDDTLCIEGAERFNGTIIDSYNDHRIAMAAAVCALRAKSRVDIEGADAVKKSYPGFFDDLVSCGAKCTFFDT